MVGIELIKKNFDTRRFFIHAGGKHVRGRIVEELEAFGFRGRRDIYYHATPTPYCPVVEVESLDAVLVFSPLAAKTIAGFELDLSNSRLISISEQTDAALEGIKSGPRLIAPAMTQEAMLTTLAS